MGYCSLWGEVQNDWRNNLLCYAVIFLAKGLIAWLYFDTLFEQKSTRKITAISFIIGYLLLFLVSIKESIFLNNSSFTLVNLALLLLNYQCNIKLAILHVLYMNFVMTIAEILSAIALMPFTNDYSAYTYNLTAMIALAVSSKLLYFMILLISSKLFRTQKNAQNSMTVLLFLLFPFSSVVVSIAFIHIAMTFSLSIVAQILMTASLLVLFLSNILLFIIYGYLQQTESEKFSMQLILQKEQADAEYYDMLQKQYDQQRILIHDIKNHLHMIHGFLQAGKVPELERYLSEFESLPALQKSMRFCENTVCNMILIQTAEQCKEKGIDFQADIREQSISFLEFTDITSLFGNLLSNAVEAAENSAQKMVDLSVRSQKDQALP